MSNNPNGGGDLKTIPGGIGMKCRDVDGRSYKDVLMSIKKSSEESKDQDDFLLLVWDMRNHVQ